MRLWHYLCGMASKERPPAARPNAAVTVDCVVFGMDMRPEASQLKVLLIERRNEPFRGMLAIPGGFVEAGESLDAAARRELQEETGLTEVFLEQLYTFGEPGRDPRGRVVSVAYYALTSLAAHEVRAGSDAARAQWHALPLPVGPQQMAFDHGQILEMALARLRGKIRYAPVGFELLSERFTLADLQRLYEAILGRKIQSAHFRRKMLSTGVLAAAGTIKGRRGPAAVAYSFNEKAYRGLMRDYARQGIVRDFFKV